MRYYIKFFYRHNEPMMYNYAFLSREKAIAFGDNQMILANELRRKRSNRSVNTSWNPSIAEDLDYFQVII